MARRQTNFRLDTDAIRVLEKAAKVSGLSKTEIVELCIIKHALNIPEVVDDARKALTDIIGQHLGGDGSKKK